MEELTENKYKSILRDIKISKLKGDFSDFKIISIDDIKKDKKLYNDLVFIGENIPNSLVCGSIALKLFGLLHRDHNDIDLMIEDENRYSYMPVGMYETEHENRLGFSKVKEVKQSKIKKLLGIKPKEKTIDFFKGEIESLDYYILEIGDLKIKVINPMYVIESKNKSVDYLMLDFFSDKNHSDIKECFNKMGYLK